LHSIQAPLRDSLFVEEQTDTAGDIVYVVRLYTHCRASLERFADIFQLQLTFGSRDNHYTPDDVKEQ